MSKHNLTYKDAKRLRSISRTINLLLIMLLGLMILLQWHHIVQLYNWMFNKS